ncbi:MAG: hypothetical protein WC521_04500 [Bdellovibrionales bacterium]|jgi:hypothetical protein
MQKKNRNLFLALIWGAALFASFAQSANAQAIYVRDDDNDYLNTQLEWIATSIVGSNPYQLNIRGGGFLPTGDFNTNTILNWRRNPTQYYNTNHLMQQVMFEIGGCWSGGAGCTKETFGNVAPDEGIGTSTSLFNTNTLVQNAFLGSSGTDKKISLYARAPVPQNLSELISDTKFGALLPEPTQKTVEGFSEKIGVVIADVLKGADQAIKSAAVKSVAAPTSQSALIAWYNRCENGFNPTSTEKNKDGITFKDPEGAYNKEIKSCTTRFDRKHERQDRSLESLLGPLQYSAPKGMAEPPEMGNPLYVRFPDKITNEDDYPIYAAAGFCQNITLNAAPMVDPGPAENNVDYLLNKAMMHETHDSRIVANCWHFFEERVQYTKGKRLEQQAARCKDDYEIRHIIDQKTSDDCQSKGRSVLKARADMAYRLDSPEYIKYLNTLGVTVRAQLMAQALDAPEKFEQSLLLERQIMTSAMAAARSESQTYGRGGSLTDIKKD